MAAVKLFDSEIKFWDEKLQKKEEKIVLMLENSSAHRGT